MNCIGHRSCAKIVTALLLILYYRKIYSIAYTSFPKHYFDLCSKEVYYTLYSLEIATRLVLALS